MIYDFKYKNDVRIKIWENESPICECKTINKITNRYSANIQKAEDKIIVVEIQLPKNNSNYGLLGTKYRSNQDIADIVVDVSEYETEQYIDNIAIKPDIVHKGIPNDYINGIIRNIEKNKELLLKCGKYEFCYGAHGEVGSSEKIFYLLTGIVLELISEQDINKESVEKIINKMCFT